MASINRGTLPQNFLDSVSAGLSLPTPEPQYFFAKMAMAGRMRLEAMNAGQDTVQQFVSMAGGGAAVDPSLDELVRAADAYPGFVQVIDAFGKGKGDTINFERDVFANSTYTEASRVLSPDGTISTVGQTIAVESVPMVLKEYIGPYDQTNSRVAPYGIWDFAAKYQAAKEQLASKTTRHLRRDFVRFLDNVILDRFVSSSNSNITYPTGIANAAAFVAGGGQTISFEQIINARKSLSDREWAPFANGKYMLLVPTSFNVQMVGDADYKTLSHNHAQGRNIIFGQIGSYQNVDIFEVSTLRSYSAGSSINGSTVAASVTLDEALLVGPGAVGFGVANDPETRWADDTNYGTVAKVIWYALMAFQTLDVRGIQRVIYQTA